MDRAVAYPVKDPSRLERLMFDAGLVVRVSLADFYDVKARTSTQRVWQDPEDYALEIDAQNTAHWGHKLHASTRSEFFAHALRDCRRVLDVGCGEGWPSLYLARTIPEVVGLDVSPEHVALARNTARLMRLDNARFLAGQIEELPFADASFDGVCFGGNVFTYGYAPARMLAEIRRVLRPGGPFAFEQWPIDPDRPAWERVLWLIDGGPPILHYGAGSGLFGRSYYIYLKSETDATAQLAEVTRHPDGPAEEDRQARRARLFGGELSPLQHQVCEAIKAQIESGDVSVVEKVEYPGEDRSLAADEFPRLLAEAGFVDVRSWAVPDGVAFARSLEASGVLPRLRPEDVRACLRALVASAPASPDWDFQWVTCRKQL